MKCPYCGGEESKVIDSRPTEDGERIRRRRECLACHKRFTTYEAVETLPLMVIKKNNSREPFDRQKVLNGMLRSCAQRPVSYEQLETAVNNIEQALLSGYDREVSSVQIGELAMQELKKIDEVAYVRFASVYRRFADVESFFHRTGKTDEGPQFLTASKRPAGESVSPPPAFFVLKPPPGQPVDVLHLDRGPPQLPQSLLLGPFVQMAAGSLQAGFQFDEVPRCADRARFPAASARTAGRPAGWPAGPRGRRPGAGPRRLSPAGRRADPQTGAPGGCCIRSAAGYPPSGQDRPRSASSDRPLSAVPGTAFFFQQEIVPGCRCPTAPGSGPPADGGLRPSVPARRRSCRRR